MAAYKVFSLLAIGLTSLVVSGCMLLSPSPISELVGEWQTLDGSKILTVNFDGSFVYTSNGETEEGTLSVSNDYELWITSKDKKTNRSMYFFIKDNRLFLGSYIMEGNGNGIRARWRYEFRMRIENKGETSCVLGYQFNDNATVVREDGITSQTNTYQLVNETKDIASIVNIGTNRYCYVLGDWKGKKMMYIVREGEYDSNVLRKK